MAVACPRPLFVFGTLCDSDVRRVVIGEGPVDPRPAVLHGHRAVRFADDAFPVLSASRGRRVAGLLLCLEPALLERVAFYEGDEYGFDPVTVEAGGGAAVEALVCADRAARDGARVPWSLQDWQRQHKNAFMPVVRRYMALFGRMSVADADREWQAMTAGGDRAGPP